MPIDYQEQLAVLCELQSIDSTLHKFRRVIEQFPEQIKEIEEAYNQAKAEFEAVDSELTSIESQKKRDEQDVAESVDKLREREARLYAIKTNKEYQAAIKEISEGKKINREREDRVLQAMEKIEQLKQKSEQLKTAFTDKEAAFNKARQEVESQTAEIKAQMADGEKRRPELIAMLDRDIRRKYEFVGKRYVDVVVKIEDGACRGCLRKIPPQMLNEMLRRNELKVCPSCQRLVYLGDKKTEGEDVPDEQKVPEGE